GWRGIDVEATAQTHNAAVFTMMHSDLETVSSDYGACHLHLPTPTTPQAHSVEALRTPGVCGRTISRLSTLPFRASTALTEFANPRSKMRLPMVLNTKPSTRPLRFLPSRTTTSSISVVPLG